jgi:hypothetical protein
MSGALLPVLLPAPIVRFMYADWVGQFPEFAGRVTPAMASAYFDAAAFVSPMVENTGRSPIQDPARLGSVLYWLTAHLAQLFGPITPGGAPSGLVGRISNAGEGSVSVGTDMGTVTTSSAWWLQTPYGAMAWQMLSPYRLGRYVPACPTPLGFDVMRRGWR